MKKTIYIFSDGELKRKDNTLFFEGENGRKFIPVENTCEIMIFGEVTLNKRFLEFLTQSEIILHFFNHYGYYVGSYYPREHLNSGYMILKQAEHYNDESKRLYLAQKFVEGAYKNIRQVLKYYSNRGKNLEDAIYSIEKLGESVDSTSTINELMAIEGNIREYYYRTFDEIIQNPDFKFDFRSKRPPQNFLNTLISFGNSLMYTVALGEIYKTHLDPRIGFLHATNFRRFSLNLDVSEIFKPIIVDRTIFTLLSKKMVTKEDFEEDAEGLLLKEKGKKVFVQEFEDKLATTIKHRTLSHNVSYRRLIRLELYKLEKHLIEEEQYKPFIAQW
ncbi:CRISPR-associated protein Cas1 [Thermoanaerobacter mathranii subsp. mathranii str. A3]|jgi:CRISPR-associated protein Cas1|uniref:CRISPR-associated endonuclease Cas1 n=2 Tax=Thermoanaerobacter TaxID=1754 RepID=D3T694_THEIA|nr:MULTISPECIES: type I-B CRISPR-associated endonuclease Cas1b [Thermoanaerobacter]ADD03488.1 CRISPR-associated protein Cas1 [Thermoanaerobacter italicus Ab9]ADH61855.1 CRISPR-associated protein Cas1 [Thermoanaerobacter mathranii subsp. mathranii str. A3]